LLIIISEIVSDVQLRKYGKFLEEYGSQLQSVEEALEDYVCDAWDMTLDPISLQVMNEHWHHCLLNFYIKKL